MKNISQKLKLIEGSDELAHNLLNNDSNVQ